MKLKVLLGLLIVSVGINLMFVLIPIVIDQYRVTSSVMMGYAFRLLDRCKESGSLPAELSSEDIDGLPLDIRYRRLDSRHATMRAVYHRLPSVTTYIGCDIEMGVKRE